MKKTPAGSQDRTDIKVEADPLLLTDAVLRPTPLLDALFQWGEASNPYSQPLMTMLCGITAFSGLMGRAYRGPTALPPCLLTVGLAPSGVGKDNPMQMMRHLYKVIGRETSIGTDELASAAGLAQEVCEKGEVFFMQDEFADFLARVGASTCPSYVKEILRMIKVWYGGGDYAGRSLKGSIGEAATIKPRVAIYGTAQPVPFWRSLTESVVIDGFLGRWLVLPCAVLDEMPNKHRSLPSECMPELIKGHIVTALENSAPPLGNVFPDTIKEVRIAYRDSEAESYSDELQREYRRNFIRRTRLHQTLEPAILGRTFEKVLRVAAVYAWTEDTRRDLTISAEALAWADTLVGAADKTVMDSMTEVGATPRQQSARSEYGRYERVLANAGEHGIYASLLIDKVRTDEQTHKAMMAQLLKAGRISVTQGRNGASKIRWIEQPEPIEEDHEIDS